MGNRAIITSHPFNPDNVGIYVHWNGGLESVEGFCQAARTLGFRDPYSDPAYALARLTQVIATFFGPDGLSVGLGRVSELDTENGIYVIGEGWRVIEQRYPEAPYECRRLKANKHPDKTGCIANQIVAALTPSTKAPPLEERVAELEAWRAAIASKDCN